MSSAAGVSIVPGLAGFWLWLRRVSGLKADLAAFGLGALSAGSLPPLHAVPVLLVSIPGLLTLIGTTSTRRRAARRGWWFGFGFHLLGLYWITEAILIEAASFWWLVPFAVPLIAAVLALFVAFTAAIARGFDVGWRRCLALAATWTLADIARQFMATGFPWNPWGSIWAIPGTAGDVLLQPAAWIGVYGLGLATLLLAATPAMSRRWQLSGVLLVVLWLLAGSIRLYSPPPAATGISALLVQGNVAQGQKWNRDLAVEILRRYLKLTQAASAGADIVIWPETAVPFLLEQEPSIRQEIAVAAQGAISLVGSVRFGQDERPRNSLFAVMPDGTIGGRYDKWHLVPFGEYQPAWLPLPIQIVAGGGFAKGLGPQTLNVPRIPPFGALICYEAIFGAQIVDEVNRPAWLINITNDAWFGNSTGPRQHLAAARLRSVEEGLPLLRAANTGFSAAFDAYGHSMGRIELGIAGTLRVDLPGRLPPTLYSRLGLSVPIFLCFVVLIFACIQTRNARALS